MLEFCGSVFALAARAPKDRFPVRIVPSALLGVREDFVGRTDFCEFNGCIFNISIVSIGVKL